MGIELVTREYAHFYTDTMIEGTGLVPHRQLSLLRNNHSPFQKAHISPCPSISHVIIAQSLRPGWRTTLANHLPSWGDRRTPTADEARQHPSHRIIRNSRVCLCHELDPVLIVSCVSGPVQRRTYQNRVTIPPTCLCRPPLRPTPNILTGDCSSTTHE